MISELRRSSLKKAIACAFHQCRAKTLALFEGMNETTFCCQAHPDFSPVGWHLGHIAYTESLWLLERSAGKCCLFPQYRNLFAADGLPKTERIKLPNLEEIRYYLNTVREKVLDYLEVADLEQQESLWRFLIQHESQHSEIITFVLELQRLSNINHQLSAQSKIVTADTRGYKAKEQTNICVHLPHRRSDFSASAVQNLAGMIHIPAGEFEMGNDSIDALDNERPMHRVYLEAYLIDRYPVTCGQYREFIEAKGYQMLEHLNWRFDGNFDPTQFEHWAFYNETEHQIEMHLRSLREQTVELRALNLTVNFGLSETILTEISRKFDLKTIQQQLQAKGLVTQKVWTDSNRWFGLLLCQLQA